MCKIFENTAWKIFLRNSYCLSNNEKKHASFYSKQLMLRCTQTGIPTGNAIPRLDPIIYQNRLNSKFSQLYSKYVLKIMNMLEI